MDISLDNSPDVNVEDTYLYEMYEEDTIYVKGGLESNTEYNEDLDMVTGLDSEVPMPKENGNYVNALVMLPRGNSYANEKVIGRKREADGNSVGSKNDNPILDTREYRVESYDGEVRKLAANVIA